MQMGVDISALPLAASRRSAPRQPTNGIKGAANHQPMQCYDTTPFIQDAEGTGHPQVQMCRTSVERTRLITGAASTRRKIWTRNLTSKHTCCRNRCLFASKTEQAQKIRSSSRHSYGPHLPTAKPLIMNAKQYDNCKGIHSLPSRDFRPFPA